VTPISVNEAPLSKWADETLWKHPGWLALAETRAKVYVTKADLVAMETAALLVACEPSPATLP